jgi:hypothetical protein
MVGEVKQSSLRETSDTELLQERYKFSLFAITCGLAIDQVKCFAACLKIICARQIIAPQAADVCQSLMFKRPVKVERSHSYNIFISG